MTEREAYIALNMMEGVGPIGVKRLVEALGSAGAIMEADLCQMRGIEGVGPVLIEAIMAGRLSANWQGELERAETMNVRILTPSDDEYPVRLKEIYDPPLALYVKGAFQSRDERAYAVVGTRKPTYYGRDTTAMLSSGLARAGYTVVSGLATGVDTVAHEEALKTGGRTIAVLGSGMSNIYPTSNIDLAKRVAEGGVLLSEFPFDRKPDKTTFPIRNRIVSGLSMGVLVVEAGIKSGAMITARVALEQGRAVSAVPGRIDSAVSKGTNRLIKEGAKLVENVDDILEEFEFLFSRESEGQTAQKKLPPLTDEEHAVVSALGGGELSIDELIREAELSASRAGAVLIGLEMKKVVRMMPGQMVELLGIN